MTGAELTKKEWEAVSNVAVWVFMFEGAEHMRRWLREIGRDNGLPAGCDVNDLVNRLAVYWGALSPKKYEALRKG
ncbi:MAG: hypothetical protein MUP14_02420 [Dehalococcoidia bacterium]|nr:hypothetical protein [Dehalococcoidia bacterium]